MNAFRSFGAWLGERPWRTGVLLAVLFLPLKLYGFETSYLNIHAARDWERGWQMLRFEQGWWHGPELLFRGSIPGFFFNVLSGLFHFPFRNPMFAAMGPPILFSASVFFVFDFLRRLYPISISVTGTLLYGALPMGTVLLRYLWNPSYLFLFTAIAVWFIVRSVMEKRRNLLAGALISLLLAFQVHITALAALLACFLCSLALRIVPARKVWALFFGLAILFFVPYIVDQWRSGWPDGVARQHLEVDAHIDIYRYRLNPNFVLPFAMQVFHQPPLDQFQLRQTFPFSYYEHYYYSSPSASRLGTYAFFLSLPLALCALGGVVSAVFRLAQRDRSPRALVLFFSLAWLLAACLPQVIWNPKTLLHGEDDFGVPVRYFIILWPVQFLFAAEGLHRLVLFTSGRFKGSVQWLPPLLMAPAIVCFVLFTVSFHLHARRTGEPFRYLHIPDWPVHTLQEKLDIAYHLVGEYGVDEEIMLTRVYTEGPILYLTEESLDFEIRTALERTPDRPEPDPELFYFIYKPHNRERIAGDYDEVERRRFKALELLVYRPLQDQQEVEVDPPISWWWY